MSEDLRLPFNPLRESLYSPFELYDRFKADVPGSLLECADLEIYAYFMRHGKNPADRGSISTLEALHDNSISAGIRSMLASWARPTRRVIAVMGGHRIPRDDPAYLEIAQIARRLTRAGACMVSGGGPGAMEATHLGALFGRLADEAPLSDAVRRLAARPRLPDATTLGALWSEATQKLNPAMANALHEWLLPAWQISQEQASAGEPPPSLAVPTWLYGFEPSTPLAPQIAKYFQNSLREDGLVTFAVDGIVYTPGKGGTVQEIFQDAAQNYYAEPGKFTPMVFWSPDGAYWSTDVPVRPLIEKLLGSRDEYAKRVLFTSSSRDVTDFLLAT